MNAPRSKGPGRKSGFWYLFVSQQTWMLSINMGDLDIQGRGEIRNYLPHRHPGVCHHANSPGVAIC